MSSPSESEVNPDSDLSGNAHKAKMCGGQMDRLIPMSVYLRMSKHDRTQEQPSNYGDQDLVPWIPKAEPNALKVYASKFILYSPSNNRMRILVRHALR